MIRIRHLHKTFGNQPILRDINLDIAKGQVVVLLGPSGSGKTTLLRCLNALEIPEQGIVEFVAPAVPLKVDFAASDVRKKIPLLRKRSGMVFQQYNLFPHKTALENVMEGPVYVQKQPKAQAQAKAEQLLSKVGLADKLSLYPSQLSGGQQQRVGIARALAIEPCLMLFDEPTSALDPELVQDVLNTMRALADDGHTMVVVTHELKFALEVADIVLVMDGGQIVEQGPAQAVFANPQHERTKAFLSRLYGR